jgi:hypothetical protein
MALKNKSLLLYGIQVTVNNQAIDFKNVSMGVEINATLAIGFYSLTGLLAAVQLALNAADPANVYTVTSDRSFSGGTQNRVTIATNGAFLSLLFSSGSRNASSAGPLLGFSGDQTGSTSYQGTSSVGTALIPAFVGYNYLSPDFYQRVQGNCSVTTSGLKEAIVFSIMRFIRIQFKYEKEADVSTNWLPWWQWVIQQRQFDFTPDYVLAPSTYYNVTLEKSPSDAKGLAFMMTEMLPSFPFLYDSGLLEFRVKDN